jgi:4-amino-4-deoxy-L-arabinose transferase-like glycosyltransferase
VLGFSVTVRVVGQPLVVAAVLFLLVACATWWRRLAHSLAVVAAFVVPLLGYAAWYHGANGDFALSDSGGRALYMRTTTWVDCSRFEVASYAETLCPDEPLGERLEPTEYGWHRPDKDAGITPPPGMTPNEVMDDFARSAIKAQPLDYAAIVGRDIALNFFVPRMDFFEYDTAGKWTFGRYIDLKPSKGWTEPAYVQHGGDLPVVHQPLAYVVSGYGYVVYLWGPVLLALLAVAVLGLFRGRGPNRSLILLMLTVGVGLMVAPAVTAEFVWRYQLPAVVLVPMAAALSWTRLRSPAPDPSPAEASA